MTKFDNRPNQRIRYIRLARGYSSIMRPEIDND